MNRWDYLDDDYEECQSWEPIRKDNSIRIGSNRPMGSLTDHLRYVAPNKNGAHKRERDDQRKFKESYIPT